jgi:hypothetical protein
MANLIVSRGTNSVSGNIISTQLCGTNIYYQLVSGSETFGSVTIDQNTGAFTFTKSISNNSENVSGSFSYNILCGSTLGSATIIENGTECIIIESYCDICDEVQQVENKLDILQSDFNAFETTFATEIAGVHNHITSTENNITGGINNAVTNINGNTDSKISATEGAIISNTNSQIANVQNQLTSAEGNIIANDNTNAGNIHNHLTNLENNLKSEIDVNESKIDNLIGLVNQTIQETDTTEEQLTALSSQLTTDVSNINNHIDQTEQDIINALTPACDVCGELQNIDDTLGNVINEINANESKIDNLQSSLNAFTTQYTSDIAQLNNNVDSVESSLINTINLAVNAINANTDSAETTILDALTTSTGNVINEINANEVKIDNILSKVNTILGIEDGEIPDIINLLAMLGEVKSSVTPCDVCDELALLKSEVLIVKQEIGVLQNTVQSNQETILKSMASIECLIKKIVPYLKN